MLKEKLVLITGLIGWLFSVSWVDRLEDEGTYWDFVVGGEGMSGYCFLLADKGERNLEKTKSDGVFNGCRGLVELV